MSQVQFVHEGCNGWAILDKTSVDAFTAKNVHVAEVNIPKYGSATLNDAGTTICGKKLKSGNLTPILITSNPSLIRSKLAELQNGGVSEVCGVCTSHFYADDMP